MACVRLPDTRNPLFPAYAVANFRCATLGEADQYRNTVWQQTLGIPGVTSFALDYNEIHLNTQSLYVEGALIGAQSQPVELNTWTPSTHGEVAYAPDASDAAPVLFSALPPSALAVAAVDDAPAPTSPGGGGCGGRCGCSGGSCPLGGSSSSSSGGGGGGMPFDTEAGNMFGDGTDYDLQESTQYLTTAATPMSSTTSAATLSFGWKEMIVLFLLFMLWRFMHQQGWS